MHLQALYFALAAKTNKPYPLYRKMPETKHNKRPSAHTLSYDTRVAAKQAAYKTAAAFEARPNAPKRRKRETPRRYIPALDGLRTIAVCAVIAYHLGLAWMPGGLQGVTIFFVLSGYLITGLLLKERDETQGIALGQFWLRRVRRLFPAIALVVIATAAVCTLLNHELLTKMRPDIPPALLWFTNWWYIFHDVSYFDAIGSPSPLQHFWSLAIEEQFYVVWPLLILGFSRITKSRKALRRACLVLAAISALAMALLYTPGADPSRVYYGTDTRAFSLLIGAWLACLQPGQRLARNYDEESILPKVLEAAGAAALVAIIVFMVLVDGYSPSLYYGGMLAVSAAAALVIAALVQPQGPFVRVMESKPLVWLGQRSYGMYLWHYPVILLIAPYVGRPTTFPWWACLIAFAITIILSALSYTFVENPIRQGALGEMWRRRQAKTVRGRASHAATRRQSRAGDEGTNKSHTSAAASKSQTSVAVSKAQTSAAASKSRTTSVRTPAKKRAPKQPILSRPAAAMASTAFVLLGVYAAYGIATVPDTSLVPEEAIQSTGVAAAEGVSVEEFLASVPASSPTGDGNDSSSDEKSSTSSSAGEETSQDDASSSSSADESNAKNDTTSSSSADDNTASEDAASSSSAEEDAANAKAGGILEAAELVRKTATQEENAPSIIQKHVDGVANPLLIGDSVPGAMYDWQQDFPYGLLDSYIGRWPWQSEDVYADYLAKGMVGHVIVLPTFNNHLVPIEEMNELVEAISPDHAVYLVNVVSTDEWAGQANAQLAEVAANHDHVHLIDWAATCASHEAEYLYDDGLHLTPDGAAAYQAMIKSAIITELAPEDVVVN